MGYRIGTVATTTFVGPLPANATETVVLITPPLTLPIDNSQVLIHGFFAFVVGTGTTSQVYRLRRGTTTAGAQISQGSWSDTYGVGVTERWGFTYVDSPGAVTGQQYCLTLVQTAATAAGTFQDGCMIAMVL